MFVLQRMAQLLYQSQNTSLSMDCDDYRARNYCLSLLTIGEYDYRNQSASVVFTKPINYKKSNSSPRRETMISNTSVKLKIVSDRPTEFDNVISTFTLNKKSLRARVSKKEGLFFPRQMTDRLKCIKKNN